MGSDIFTQQPGTQDLFSYDSIVHLNTKILLYSIFCIAICILHVLLLVIYVTIKCRRRTDYQWILVKYGFRIENKFSINFNQVLNTNYAYNIWFSYTFLSCHVNNSMFWLSKRICLYTICKIIVVIYVTNWVSDVIAWLSHMNVEAFVFAWLIINIHTI